MNKENYKIDDIVELKSYEDLKNCVHIPYLMFKDILGQKVKIKEILYTQKVDLFGVKLGGLTRYFIETKSGSEFLIEPSFIKDLPT